MNFVVLFYFLIYAFCMSVHLWIKHCWQSCLNSHILFNSFVNSAANYSPWFKIILSSNLCNFYMLSLNNPTSPSANVPSFVATKCTILNNLLYTTSIMSFSVASSNFVMKFTIKWIYSFFNILFTISFSPSASIQFFIFWHKSHPSTYFSISFIPPSHQ